LGRIPEETELSPPVFEMEKVRQSMEEFLSVPMSHNEQKVRRENELRRLALKEGVMPQSKMMETATRPAELIDRVRNLLRKRDRIEMQVKGDGGKETEMNVKVVLPMKTMTEPMSRYRKKMRTFDRSFPKRLYEWRK
jgi:hypothetical protein